MKTITLFAAGLSQGKKLADNANSMAAYSNEEVSIETVTDFSLMARSGVQQLPAVAIDGRVVCQGRVPTVEEFNSWVNTSVA